MIVYHVKKTFPSRVGSKWILFAYFMMKIDFTMRYFASKKQRAKKQALPSLESLDNS